MVFYFSFRVDMVHDYNDYMLLFFDFMNIFDCYDYLVTFEDKTKGGVPTKPHFHGVLKIDYSKKVESIRDKLKKYFNTTGHDGTLSQIKIINDNEEYNKALMYILKWDDVQMTDLDDIDNIRELAKDYNQQIRQKGLNTWKDHSKEIFKLIEQAHLKSKNIGRYTMLTIIHTYIYNWNKTHEEDLSISRPCNNTIMTFLQNTEFKINNQQDSLSIFLNDFDNITSCRANLYESKLEEGVLLYDVNDPLSYIDDDNKQYNYISQA